MRSGCFLGALWRALRDDTSTTIDSPNQSGSDRPGDHESVPAFETYYPRVDDMNNEARAFYRYWLMNWQSGRAVDVQGNISYLFTYARDVISWREQRQYSRVVRELQSLLTLYEHETGFTKYAVEWLIETHLMFDRPKRALEALHNCHYLFASEDAWNQRLLGLKHQIGEDLTATLAHVLFDPSLLTEHGRALQEECKREFVRMYSEFKRNQPSDPLFRIAASVSNHGLFDYSPVARERVANMLREAENRVRQAQGLPRVGEGWVSETKLRNIVQALVGPDITVEFHARPEWLEGQEIDIFIPELELGIEYMGRQHYEPVDHFGGEDSYERTIERDKRKAEKCREKRIHLIHFCYNEELQPDHVRERLAKHIRHRPNNAITTEPIVRGPSYAQVRSELTQLHRKVSAAQPKSTSKARRPIEGIKIPESTQYAQQALHAFLHHRLPKGVKLLQQACVRHDKEKGLRAGDYNHISVRGVREEMNSVGRFLESPADLILLAKAEAAIARYAPFHRIWAGKRSVLLESILTFSDFQANWERILRHRFSQAWQEAIIAEHKLRSIDTKDRSSDHLIRLQFIDQATLAMGHSVCHQATGLSIEARELLCRATLPKRPIQLLSHRCWGLWDPRGALAELVTAGLATIDIPAADLLTLLTVQELENCFRDHASQWDGGNKQDKINWIVETVSDEAVSAVISLATESDVAFRLVAENPDVLRRFYETQRALIQLIDSRERDT